MLLPCVLPKMTGCLTGEAATVTVERLFSIVNAFVYIQIISLIGGIAALVTLEWLFS